MKKISEIHYKRDLLSISGAGVISASNYNIYTYHKDVVTEILFDAMSIYHLALVSGRQC